MTICPACNFEITEEPFFYCKKQPVDENVLFGNVESAKKDVLFNIHGVEVTIFAYLIYLI